MGWNVVLELASRVITLSPEAYLAAQISEEPIPVDCFS